MLADKIGPIGVDPGLWALYTVAALGFTFLGGIAGWLAGRMDLRHRRAERRAAKAAKAGLARMVHTQTVGTPSTACGIVRHRARRGAPAVVLDIQPADVDLVAYRSDITVAAVVHAYDPGPATWLHPPLARQFKAGNR